MRRSKALAKIRAGKPVRICNMGNFSPAYIRWAAHCGFDCIWLDMEHKALSLHQIQALMAHFHLHDVDCMLRAPTLEKTGLYRYFEEGATGLMIPLVSTAEKAKMLVDAVKFPPIGGRGLDGAGLDADYFVKGPTHTAQWIEDANRETFLVVQIETIEAVESIEAIAAVPGVDGVFVGPGDLGLRLRVAGASAPFTLDQAVERVAATCKKLGKAWGMPAAGVDNLKKLTAMGAQLCNHGSEFFAMKNELETRGREWKEILGE